MQAVITGQYEGAAALLVAKAEVDVLNGRKTTALDLAKEIGVPQFLMKGLQGDLTDCERMAASALSNRYPFETSF